MTWEEYDILTIRLEKATELHEDYERVVASKRRLLNLKDILTDTYDANKYNEGIDSSLTRLVGGDKPRKLRAIDILVKFLDDEIEDISRKVERI